MGSENGWVPAGGGARKGGEPPAVTLPGKGVRTEPQVARPEDSSTERQALAWGSTLLVFAPQNTEFQRGPENRAASPAAFPGFSFTSDFLIKLQSGLSL